MKISFKYIKKAVLFGLILCSVKLNAQVINVKIDTTVTYQKILGWGTDLFIETAEIYVPILQENLVELITNHLGCNAYRWEISRRNNEDYANDNEDPDVTDWDYFKPDYCDAQAREVVLPMKKMVEARGEKFTLYSSTSFFIQGDSGDCPEWLRSSPAEMSEWLIAHLTYVKKKYGIEIDNICVANEPDNKNRFTAEIIGDMIKYLGPKLKEKGFNTSVIYPEHAMVTGALDYLERWKDDPEVMDYIGCIAYHLYFETSYCETEKQQIYEIAKARNIPIAQTEYMGANFDILYSDLVYGNVSYWYVYLPSDYYQLNSNFNSYTLKDNYWNIRQVLKYVKQGSFRTEAVTDKPDAAKVMAFKKNGDIVTVCYNTSDSDIELILNNLPAGSYAINKGKIEEGIFKVDKSSVLKIKLGKEEIATIYPTKGINQPPLITDWKAEPSYLTLPVTSTALSVVVDDQEKDNINYSWVVNKKPDGANVTFQNAYSATTIAEGLDKEGLYEFSVTISDGTNTVEQKLVPVMVVKGNQAPMIKYLSNKIPVYTHVPEACKTSAVTWAMDRDGDNVTYSWSIIDQPKGADATFNISRGGRNCNLENMNVAGNYFVRLEVTDSINTVADTLKIKVLPKNNPPEIVSIKASSEKVLLSDSTVKLSAKATDADGNHLGYWWKAIITPEGAKPVFSSPGRTETDVSGLTIPGKYTFAFIAADNLEKITKEISVEVKK